MVLKKQICSTSLSPYFYLTPVYYCKTFTWRVNYYRFYVVKQEGFITDEQRNLQIYQNMNYLCCVSCRKRSSGCWRFTSCRWWRYLEMLMDWMKSKRIFSRVPTGGLRLKMGSLVLLPLSHPVLFVYTNRANPVRDCRLINQIPKLCQVFLTSRDKLIWQLFRSVFSLRKIGI